MGSGKTSIHVFNSWQSDSSKKTNLNAIRRALSEACKRIEAATPSFKLIPDEATRDTSGSPNTTIGNFPGDLPFDFIQNRAHGYDYADGDPASKRDNLSQFLETAIKSVLNKNPKKPA